MVEAIVLLATGTLLALVALAAEELGPRVRSRARSARRRCEPVIG